MRDKDREPGRFTIILAEDPRKSDISDLIATPFAQSGVVTTMSEVPADRFIRSPKLAKQFMWRARERVGGKSVNGMRRVQRFDGACEQRWASASLSQCVGAPLK